MELLTKINEDGRIHLMPGECKGVSFIRYVCSTRTEPEDVEVVWSVIVELANKLLNSQSLSIFAAFRKIMKELVRSDSQKRGDQRAIAAEGDGA